MAEPGTTPAPLRLVEDFVNTRSVELGTDDLATPGALAEWLRARDLLAVDAPVGPAELRRAVRLREGVRALVAASHGALPAMSDPDDGLDPGALAELGVLARRLALVVDVTQDPPRLAPAAPGTVDAALAAVLAAIAEAAADGSWARFKVCREPGCRWVYYDRSRNRSRRVVLDGDVREPGQGPGVPHPRPLRARGVRGARQVIAARTRATAASPATSTGSGVRKARLKMNAPSSRQSISSASSCARPPSMPALRK